MAVCLVLHQRLLTKLSSKTADAGCQNWCCQTRCYPGGRVCSPQMLKMQYYYCRYYYFLFALYLVTYKNYVALIYVDAILVLFLECKSTCKLHVSHVSAMWLTIPKFCCSLSLEMVSNLLVRAYTENPLLHAENRLQFTPQDKTVNNSTTL